MGLFDSLKNKAKEIAKAVEATENKNDQNVQHEEEQIQYEEENEVEIDEEEYKYSDKIIQGVHYPNGWEELEEAEILEKLNEVFQEVDDADGDDDKEDAVFKKHGFEGAGHYEDFRNAIRIERAEQEGVSYTQGTANQYAETQAASLDAAVNSDREDLKPVDGISLELWAKANVTVINSGGVDEALKLTGKDKAGWDKVSQEWNTRMSNDSTMVIMQVYSSAFTATPSQGENEVTIDSFPFEKYIEVRVAQDILCQQGKDAQEVLALFDMTVLDWSNVSAFWSKEFHSNIDKYLPLDTEYTEKYKAKYKAGDSNSDIEF